MVDSYDAISRMLIKYCSHESYKGINFYQGCDEKLPECNNTSLDYVEHRFYYDMNPDECIYTHNYSYEVPSSIDMNRQYINKEDVNK
jgi:hypothetical protein